MYKDLTDYSNTIFYKITCKDPTITDTYIGHTTNFVTRKCSHRNACNYPINAYHNFKVYQFIRANGGWNNWNMSIIGFKNCMNLQEARMEEQKYFVQHNATLNSIQPYITETSLNDITKRVSPHTSENESLKETIILNDVQDNTVTNQSDLSHNYIVNDTYDLNDTDKVQFIPKVKCKKLYSCLKCNFQSRNKKDYNKHLQTKKHERNMNEQNDDSNERSNQCECGKIYRYPSGLSRHKRICKLNNTYNQMNQYNTKFVSNLDFIDTTNANVIYVVLQR